MAIIHCPECGNEISSSATTCIHCGYKLRAKKKRAKQRKIKKIAGLLVIMLLIIAILFAVWRFVYPDLFVSVDELLANGEYQNAYDRADESRREAIVIENLIAYTCLDVIDSMRDPSSFLLGNAFYIPDEEILLEVQGKNAYGGYTTNYWVYEYDDTTGAYDFTEALTSWEEKEVYSFDDTYERMEKYAYNIVLESVYINLLQGEYKSLSNESVDNINSLFQADMLEKVVLIDIGETKSLTDSLSESEIPQAEGTAATDTPLSDAETAL